MSIDAPPPIVPFEPVAPDADWETIRARTMAQLALGAAPGWTDHNVADPGVTLAEAAAYSLADVHYRLANVGFEHWPLSWHGWQDPAERHWHSTLPEADAATGRLASLAAAVAAASAIAGRNLERDLAASETRLEAEALLAAPPWTAAVPPAARAATLALLRGRHVRRVAQENADAVSDAVFAADAVGGSRAARDALAAGKVGLRLPLWADECEALVRRERRRLAGEAADANFAKAARVSSSGERAALLADLASAGLDTEEATFAALAPRSPFGAVPEDLEAADGQSLVWPPHPIQALTCEPVVSGDYARRARTHSAVGRAWAVQGRLEGIAWNGLRTPDAAFLPAGDARHAWAIDPAAKAVTVVVDCPDAAAPVDELLREILATAVGSEVRRPFPSWRDNVDTLDPRRLIADEVGIALLKREFVIVQATLVIPPTASRTAVKAEAAARVSAFFENGRPETVAEAAEDPHTGPWPPAPQPPGGWVPGEPIRFSEVVAILSSVRDVIAVREVSMMVATDPGWTPASASLLPIPKGSVPELGDGGCFITEFHLTGACSDA